MDNEHLLQQIVHTAYKFGSHLDCNFATKKNGAPVNSIRLNHSQATMDMMYFKLLKFKPNLNDLPLMNS